MMLTALAKMQQDREVAVDLSEVQCPICLSVPPRDSCSLDTRSIAHCKFRKKFC